MIDFKKSLNLAQYQAVTQVEGAMLVIAGAGSGKTRTIVYRLAYLSEQGIDPAQMLLLTFTRKAAQAMLQRTALLFKHSQNDYDNIAHNANTEANIPLGMNALHVQGGTFHSFAYAALRRHKPAWLDSKNVSLMDSSDISSAIKHCKDELKLGKGDRSFPKTQAIISILSKSRNKELSIEEILRRESFHILGHAEALSELHKAYALYKRKHALLDYDDLLFELELLLSENEAAAGYLRNRYQYIMVDEYQDTNLVQARIVNLLASKEYGGSGNIMAVGDDAQSIYAFRGANVRNILDFQKYFPDVNIVKLEENYRSTQPILDVANALLEDAKEGYAKKLFTNKEGGEIVRIVSPLNDERQAELITGKILKLLHDYEPSEIAVLFRAGFHSYKLELALNKVGVSFRKYGGLKYTEAAHVKDIIAFARLCINPLDMPAFQRIASLHKGIGPKTAQKLYDITNSGTAKDIEKAFARYPDFLINMHFLDEARTNLLPPKDQLFQIVEHYKPMLEILYPDDWPRRQQGLEEIIYMAQSYDSLDLFIAELTLESPEEDEQAQNCITLSTVHSAKGLEWNAVLIIDLVEDRFPSRHALVQLDDFEEERRLLYVACTRARESLDLYSPISIYSRGDNARIIATRSPFLRELPAHCYDEYVEGYDGKIRAKREHSIPSFNEDFKENNYYKKNDCLGQNKTDAYTVQRDNSFRNYGAENNKTAFEGKNNKTASEGEHNNSSMNDYAKTSPRALGYCYHKIFGRGKLLKYLPPDKYQVNFMGFGVKTILADYLSFEE